MLCNPLSIRLYVTVPLAHIVFLAYLPTADNHWIPSLAGKSTSSVLRDAAERSRHAILKRRRLRDGF
jgi:hypothetical protein